MRAISSLTVNRWTRLGAVALLMAAAPLLAREGADPALNRPFDDPVFQEWVERFESEGREVYDRREAIVAATGARPGMTVADVGAGTGLFTRLFAREVGPAGRVYAVDISRRFVDNVLRTSRAQGFANVEGVVNSHTDTALPADAVDIVFVCDTYHHFEQPRAMLRSIHRALRPGGTLVVVDFERIEGRSSGWVLSHVRTGREQVIREIEAEGFELTGQPPLLRNNFFLKFVRRP